MYTASDPLQKIEKDTEEYRDHINTIRPDGKRAWVFAKKPKGRFYQWRNLVSYLLLALMFLGPYVRIHGQPLLLVNVLERKFILFGFVFWPQDFYLVVLALLTMILTIVLFTSVLGRIWCGWTCPQTVFMEMVFRKIEYLIEGDFQQQKQLDQSPWNANKVIRKGGKLFVFYAISFAIANTFLAYIIGSEELFKIISEPVTQHVAGFVAINIFTIVFFLVFARFREQVCHFACPYGRFQSALVDNDTISVTYDFKRGEKRGTLGARKKAGFSLVAAAEAGGASQAQLNAGSNPYGDCIDCGSCVVVCPSGIDIRNGIQLECVQCTACIDACDKMMDAVGKPRGLIRYTSYNNVKDGKNSLFKFRTAGYLAVWLLVLSIFTGLLLTREQIETVLLRQPGMLAQRLPDGFVGNMYSLKVFNKTFESQKTDIRLSPEFADKGEIRFIDTMTETAAQNFTQVRFIVALKPEAIGTVNIPIEFDILLNGQLLRKKQTVFIAPGK
ncbi:MAG TPA: cytochrome c oxidase accessory protein CcoG [Turneriella sp.]|nr:cytochrome c oxidase accessory protein CcoG [Turneriella sp.]HNN00005.1 cytochrome c oxidase accessory protein CcoG [Turneriella sp.]